MSKFLFLIALFFADQMWSQLPAFQNFVPERGGFSVMVPGGLMKHTIREVETDIGNLDYNTYAIDFNSKDKKYFAFILSYTDYPPGGIHSDSSELLKDFFDVAVKESIFLMRGKLIYDSEEKYLNYPAYMWRINYRNDRASIRNKSIMVGSRYYLLQVISEPDVHSGNIAQDFLDSFKLL